MEYKVGQPSWAYQSVSAPISVPTEYKVGQPPWAYQSVSSPISVPTPAPISAPISAEAPIIATEEPSEIMHGLINGLASTISLWIFWVPFIIFIARPLINAQVKEEVCLASDSIREERRYLAYEYNKYLYLALYNLLAEGKITEAQRDELYEKYSWNQYNSVIPADLKHTLDTNTQKNWDDNFGLITIFSIALACIVVGCVFIILAACSVSGIDPYQIFWFNLVMTLIIVIIECAFFGGVTMRYMPYNLNAILAQSEQKILGFFN
jgi:hypothetical protein